MHWIKADIFSEISRACKRLFRFKNLSERTVNSSKNYFSLLFVVFKHAYRDVQFSASINKLMKDEANFDQTDFSL